MRAAVTQGKGAMRVVDVPDPGEPELGEVIVRPEAVGLCGSDFHYFLGDLGAVESAQLYPRIQGHEAAGIVEAVGPDCPAHLRVGERVAIWPLASCGRCYPCRIGRRNVCGNISLIGIHRDGALQGRLRVPASQVFPVGDQDPAVAALIEPVSIAVARSFGVESRKERRWSSSAQARSGRPSPSPQSTGASVLLVDRLQSRLERGKATGAEFSPPGR